MYTSTKICSIITCMYVYIYYIYGYDCRFSPWLWTYYYTCTVSWANCTKWPTKSVLGFQCQREHVYISRYIMIYIYIAKLVLSRLRSMVSANKINGIYCWQLRGTHMSWIPWTFFRLRWGNKHQQRSSAAATTTAFFLQCPETEKNQPESCDLLGGFW